MDRSVLYTNGICERCIARRNTPYYDTWEKNYLVALRKDATAVLNVGTDISKTFIQKKLQISHLDEFLTIINKSEAFNQWGFLHPH